MAIELDWLKESELAALEALLKESFTVEIDVESLWNHLDFRHRSLIAHVNGEVVGHVLITTSEDFVQRKIYYTLDYVCVQKQNRKKGIGTFLLQAIETMGNKENIDFIHFTSGNKRTEAHQFYLENDYLIRDTSMFYKNLK